MSPLPPTNRLLPGSSEPPMSAIEMAPVGDSVSFRQV
jgi:hypothetical protein